MRLRALSASAGVGVQRGEVEDECNEANETSGQHTTSFVKGGTEAD